MKSFQSLIFLGIFVLAHCLSASDRPNVLFIAIDDQNDWIGWMGGHPSVETPHIDRLAQRGTAFLNAHCQAPLCNPSRASLLLGLRPSTTGIYGLAPWFRELPEYRDWVTLPQHFAAHGYRTLATGKIYHQGRKQRENLNAGLFGGTPYTPEFEIEGAAGGIGARPDRKLIGETPEGNNPLMDWGVFPHQDEEKGDYQVADWVIEQLRDRSHDQPFFVAAGFFLPHVPLYITQPWYDRYRELSSENLLPLIRRDDREDTPRFSWYLHWRLPEPRLAWTESAGQWENLVRSYLGATTFIDAQIGRILQVLEDEDLLQNTLVVLWSDHGYHLGEKLITGKNTLWQESTRVPLIFAGPGVKPGQDCAQPVELLDIFPTLIDLCGLSARPELEGISLRPQLEDASSPRLRPAITTHNQGNHSVVSQRYRFIQYADGSEELYDLYTDPHEWDNLAAEPALSPILQQHRRWIPRINRNPAPGSRHRILTYDPLNDSASWQNEPILRFSPVP